MARFEIDATDIRDETSFHAVFQDALGFFDGYGRNMNAWIDCMNDLHGPRSLSSFNLPEGEPVDLMFRGTDEFGRRCPELLRELVECTAAVNRRYRSMNSEVRVALVFRAAPTQPAPDRRRYPNLRL